MRVEVGLCVGGDGNAPQKSYRWMDNVSVKQRFTAVVVWFVSRITQGSGVDAAFKQTDEQALDFWFSSLLPLWFHSCDS